MSGRDTGGGGVAGEGLVVVAGGGLGTRLSGKTAFLAEVLGLLQASTCSQIQQVLAWLNEVPAGPECCCDPSYAAAAGPM